MGKLKRSSEACVPLCLMAGTWVFAVVSCAQAALPNPQRRRSTGSRGLLTSEGRRFRHSIRSFAQRHLEEPSGSARSQCGKNRRVPPRKSRSANIALQDRTMATFVISSDSELGSPPPPPVSAADAAGVEGDGPEGRPAQTSLDDPDWVKSFTPERKRNGRGIGERNDNSDPKTSADAVWSAGESDNQDIDLLDDSISADQTKSQEVAIEVKNDVISEGSAVDRSAVGNAAVEGLVGSQGETSAGETSRRVGKAKSTLPLLAAPKLDENLVLVQSQTEGFDLSGDVGAVGRIKIDDRGLQLDIKGLLYSCDVYDTNSICVVTLGDDEARVSAVIDEAVTLWEDTTLENGAEQLVSGQLDADDTVAMDADDTETAALDPGQKPRAGATPGGKKGTGRASKANPSTKVKKPSKPRTAAKSSSAARSKARSSAVTKAGRKPKR